MLMTWTRVGQAAMWPTVSVMVLKTTEIHKFKNGRLHLCNRNDCKFWMCRFFVFGDVMKIESKK